MGLPLDINLNSKELQTSRKKIADISSLLASESLKAFLVYSSEKQIRCESNYQIEYDPI
jgi:hypothetical protein